MRRGMAMVFDSRSQKGRHRVKKALTSRACCPRDEWAEEGAGECTVDGGKSQVTNGPRGGSDLFEASKTVRSCEPRTGRVIPAGSGEGPLGSPRKALGVCCRFGCPPDRTGAAAVLPETAAAP